MTPRLARLVDLVRAGLGWADAVEPLGDGEEEIWELARQHRVYSILVPAILSRGGPAGLVEEARQLWQLAALREAFHTQACDELVELLGREGIPAHPLKGVRLAREAYPKRGFRPYRDLDLLVRAADLEAADRCLRESGFEEIHPEGPLRGAVRARGSSLRAAAHGIDAVSYRRGDLNLELHTRFLPPLLGEYPMEVPGIGRTVEREDFFAHLLIHATRHHFLFGLRHLVDLAVWGITEGEARSVADRLRACDLLWLAWPAWAFAGEFFPERVPGAPSCRERRVRVYTAAVRNRLETMPLDAVALAGSPLPFVLLRRRVFLRALGGRGVAEYQTGHAAAGRHVTWALERPFGLVRRHAPVACSWIRWLISSPASRPEPPRRKTTEASPPTS